MTEPHGVTCPRRGLFLKAHSVGSGAFSEYLICQCSTLPSLSQLLSSNPEAHRGSFVTLGNTGDCVATGVKAKHFTQYTSWLAHREWGR